MHQPVDSPEKPLSEKDRLLKARGNLMAKYRATIQNAMRALDYYLRFRKVEDWDEDSVQDYMNILKKDSKRHIREVAVEVSRVRGQIDLINNKLMDLAKKDEK